MNKLVKDGKVAVLYSPGFGAGWYSWNTEHPDMIFDAGMVDLVIKGDLAQMRAYASVKWPGAYLGGLESLQVEWVDPGQQIKIEDYDGSESIEYRDAIDWITV